MSSLASFLASKAFLKNVLFAFIIGFILIWGVLWLTDYYTYHGESIVVPDLTKKQLNEVEQITKNYNLTYTVKDSVFNKEAKPGSVIEQFPDSGEKVKRLRTIKLTIASITPQKVTIERVKDLSLRQAIGQLSKQGIIVKRLQYIYSSYTNLVIGISLNERQLNKGDEIYKGDEVTLIVGKNIGVSLTVPNLEGLTADYAKRKALEAGFNINKMTFQNSSKEMRKMSMVKYQSLNAGSSTTPGAEINLILAVPDKL